jgi:gliding motility-associated lipoprotein GldD
MKNLIVHCIPVFVVVIAWSACNSDYTPRQKGYFRIDFPKHEYTTFDRPEYPYTFEYPVYAAVKKDTSIFSDDTEEGYWINIEFPRFYGRIYISYKEIGKTDFQKLVNDAFQMTYKHTSKASEISDSLMRTPMGLTGMFFRVGGNAATARQFYVTDSVKHFIRGSLYFDATPNEDSLAVVNDFLQEDMKHLINTLRWKK